MTSTTSAGQLRPLRKVTTLIYALYALAVLGFGMTAVIAIVINYIKIDDVRGTWLESHFRWQIRTFWFSVLWMTVGALTFLIAIGWLIMVATCVWYIYRIAKGWLYLNEGKPVHHS